MRHDANADVRFYRVITIGTESVKYSGHTEPEAQSTKTKWQRNTE